MPLFPPRPPQIAQGQGISISELRAYWGDVDGLIGGLDDLTLFALQGESKALLF